MELFSYLNIVPHSYLAKIDMVPLLKYLQKSTIEKLM